MDREYRISLILPVDEHANQTRHAWPAADVATEAPPIKPIVTGDPA